MVDLGTLLVWRPMFAFPLSDRYTGRAMQQFFNNRYVRMAGLTLGLALMFYVIIWLVFSIVGLKDFPQGIQVMFALLAAGLVVYKFLAGRIA